jgi:hypothetical protein
MLFKCLLSGFTTISSVSLISSTTSPNCRPSASSTTMFTAGPSKSFRSLAVDSSMPLREAGSAASPAFVPTFSSRFK